MSSRVQEDCRYNYQRPPASTVTSRTHVHNQGWTVQRRRRAATGTAMAAAAALAMANLSTFCCVEGFVSPAGLRPVGANLLGIHRSGCHHRDCQQRSKWTSTPKSNSKLRATSQQYPLYTSIDSSENLAVPAGGGGGSAARPPKSSAVLSPGDVIEFWHAKSLMFGNYCGLVKGRRSLAVRAASGESLVIDAGQIVGLWPQGENGCLRRVGGRCRIVVCFYETCLCYLIRRTNGAAAKFRWALVSMGKVENSNVEHGEVEE